MVLLTFAFLDFAFAIVIGVVFQYFSIAPMAGEYGPKIFYRAAKADFFSLLFFEIGLFGWMAIFQVAIFHWRLQMDTVTYWFMMQVFSSLHLMNCTCDITLMRSRADWDVPWALDWSANQLVVDQNWRQGAVCITACWDRSQAAWSCHDVVIEHST